MIHQTTISAFSSPKPHLSSNPRKAARLVRLASHYFENQSPQDSLLENQPLSGDKNDNTSSDLSSRRQTLAAFTLAATTILSAQQRAKAIQGLTAGRIPGVTGPDKDGYYLYTRPEGKSGGHGVGWSEVPRYSFKVPVGWEEVPVSIADLGGSEIDLKYSSANAGTFAVVVAPVLRFLDVGYNANIRLTDLGPPDKIISGFAPEILGQPLDDGDIITTEEQTIDGIPYYFWEVKPHHLVAATATGNRVFILYTNSANRQWRKAENELRIIQKSFRVPSK